ncbi:MAG TPA: hypothetical protein VKF80_02780 [Candidatus Eisenbacteria bacterium]|nr:hypothetical protein [Candidatus Eisenbacteria bacterium]
MQIAFRRWAGALVAGALIGLPAVASAAEGLESEIELLRTDIKAGKVELVKNVLQVEGAKADAFWPVYRQYQLDLDKIGDKRLAVIKDYAANYDHMTDAKAKSLVNQALDLQAQRTDLLKKYYKNFEKVLGPIDAAKLVQTEYLVMALMDVQVGASIPLMEKPTAAASP